MGDNRLVCRAKREDRSEYVDGYYVMLTRHRQSLAHHC